MSQTASLVDTQDSFRSPLFGPFLKALLHPKEINFAAQPVVVSAGAPFDEVERQR